MLWFQLDRVSGRYAVASVATAVRHNVEGDVEVGEIDFSGLHKFVDRHLASGRWNQLSEIFSAHTHILILVVLVAFRYIVAAECPRYRLGGRMKRQRMAARF